MNSLRVRNFREWLPHKVNNYNYKLGVINYVKKKDYSRKLEDEYDT